MTVGVVATAAEFRMKGKCMPVWNIRIIQCANNQHARIGLVATLQIVIGQYDAMRSAAFWSTVGSPHSSYSCSVSAILVVMDVVTSKKAFTKTTDPKSSGDRLTAAPTVTPPALNALAVN
eukprot:CAMPEP_0119022250 /NCGR_PEP_ID=MMETSP1176-20130426/27552_1 /TAXON_ID=265551 /ORGANISM="Synedropsis recta cf, Strain CCMP1620" /LENGTH=119 /DNA_ID=CAMNT_0006977033 /DNA_START=110 /DNA_END=470 /DNA_ORIENTATION=-